MNRQPNQGQNLAYMYPDVLRTKAVQSPEHSELARLADHPPSVLSLLHLAAHEALKHAVIRLRRCQSLNHGCRR